MIIKSDPKVVLIIDSTEEKQKMPIVMHSKKNPQLCTVRKNRIQTQKIVNMKLRIELRKDARLQAVSKPGLLPVFTDTAS